MNHSPALTAAIGTDSRRILSQIGGPGAAADPWHHKAVEGVGRFLDRVLRIADRVPAESCAPEAEMECISDKYLRRSIHETIRDVTAAMDSGQYEAAFHRLIVCSASFDAAEPVPVAALVTFLRCLHPMAPALTSEIHRRLASALPGIPDLGSLPEFDPAALVMDETEIDLRVNNGLVGRITVALDAETTTVEAAAIAAPAVAAAVGTGTVVKIVVVPGRLVNVVVARR